MKTVKAINSVQAVLVIVTDPKALTAGQLTKIGNAWHYCTPGGKRGRLNPTHGLTEVNGVVTSGTPVAVENGLLVSLTNGEWVYSRPK